MPRPQQAATGPYPTRDKSSPHPPLKTCLPELITEQFISLIYVITLQCSCYAGKVPYNSNVNQMNDRLCRKNKNMLCVRPQQYALFKKKVDMQTSTLPTRLASTLLVDTTYRYRKVRVTRLALTLRNRTSRFRLPIGMPVRFHKFYGSPEIVWPFSTVPRLRA